jgi:hypothetical protein
MFPRQTGWGAARRMHHDVGDQLFGGTAEHRSVLQWGGQFRKIFCDIPVTLCYYAFVHQTTRT